MSESTIKLQEAANVAWLRFKPDLGGLLDDHNEPEWRLMFMRGFASGFGYGAEETHKGHMEILDRKMMTG